jgi:thymidylate synthase (FAD)
MIKVSYIDHMGDDVSVVNAARVSFGKNTDELKQEDIKLIKYLAEHQHHTSFEHVTLKILIECPLAIRSQIHRHRSFSYNEISRRYVSENIEFYVPPVEDIRKQSKNNKQGSEGNLTEEKSQEAVEMIEICYERCNAAYETLLNMGVAREQARFVLPTGLMTKFYMCGNLRNLAHFVKLRIDPHAQKEAQIIGSMVLDIMKDKVPVSTEALMAF